MGCWKEAERRNQSAQAICPWDAVPKTVEMDAVLQIFVQRGVALKTAEMDVVPKIFV